MFFWKRFKVVVKGGAYELYELERYNKEWSVLELIGYLLMTAPLVLPLVFDILQRGTPWDYTKIGTYQDYEQLIDAKAALTEKTYYMN